MPFVEVFTREELSDAVRAKLAESLLVTMMNLEIGRPNRSCTGDRLGMVPHSAWNRMGSRRSV
jgi:hypothetical protein